jgi:hypothetical protein
MSADTPYPSNASSLFITVSIRRRCSAVSVRNSKPYRAHCDCAPRAHPEALGRSIQDEFQLDNRSDPKFTRNEGGKTAGG